MSFFSNTKGALGAINDFFSKKNSVKTISKLIRFVAITCILFSLLLCYWDLTRLISCPNLPLWNTNLRSLIKNPILIVMWVWVLYMVIFKELFKHLFINLEVKYKKQVLPIWFTTEDIIDICFSLYFLIYGVCLLVEVLNGIKVLYQAKNVYWGVVLYCIFRAIQWLYIQNSERWYNVTRRYTDFYDCKGNKIPEKSFVIYYRQRYRVYLSGASGGNLGEACKKEWRIESMDRFSKHKDFPLEQAAKEENGKLMVEKYFEELG